MTDEFRDLGAFKPEQPATPDPAPTAPHGDEIGGWTILGFVALVVGSAIVAVSMDQGDSPASVIAGVIGSLLSLVGFFALIVAAVAKGVQIGNRS